MSQTVLIAEDSRTIRTICQWLFKGTPYQMIPAETGAEALSVAQQQRPGMIILDYTLPDQDSYELCRRLKSDPNLSSIPVLMLGGKFAEFNETRADECGADGFVMKPFRSENFLNTIAETFAKAAAGDVKRLAAAAPTPPPPSRQPPARSNKRFSFPAGESAQQQHPPQQQPPPPQPPGRPSFSLGRGGAPAGAGNDQLTPPPQARPQAAASVAIDPGVVREEIQSVVKEMLPGIVRGVLKELITKEVTPHLQRWVEGKVEAIAERKIRSELERMRRGGS